MIESLTVLLTWRKSGRDKVGKSQEEEEGGGDVDWQSLTQSSPSEDQTAARRVWLMVTDGDCWPHPSLPIVQQLSQDSVMDSGATPFIPLRYQWTRCHLQAPIASNCIAFIAFIFSEMAHLDQLILANLRGNPLNSMAV